MATAIFSAAFVAKRAAERIEDERTKASATHEKGIQKLMAAPIKCGFLWRKTRYRTSEEAENYYGATTQHHHSLWYWNNLKFTIVIDRLLPLWRLARAAVEHGTTTITLSDEDCEILRLSAATQAT